MPIIGENAISSTWEAGETGCAQLIVGLKRELDQIRQGELLRIIALSAGAPSDVPAWCRMTGHKLVLANHPLYIVRKKDDPIYQRNHHEAGEQNV